LSLQKTVKKLKPDFARDNAHVKLVVPAKLVETGQAQTRDDQDDVLVPTEPMFPARVTMHMADPGKVRDHTAILTNTLPNPTRKGLAKLETFTNVLTPTTKLTNDIISSIV
jgi:hypothetical protein